MAETAATAVSPGDTAIPPRATNPRAWRALWPVLVAAVALCLIAAAATIQWRPIRQEAGPQLSIVVLPFENMSGDKDQDYFADGITDDLTTDLSHLQDSFVISRGTAFTFKGKPVDAKQIGHELGVRYLLDGSRAPPRRKSGGQRPARFDRDGRACLGRPLRGRARPARRLAARSRLPARHSLGVELVKAEALRAARERPSNPDAVDLAVRAEVKEHLYSSDRKATINEAVALSERALTLDPQNVRALTVLANALLDREGDYYSDDPAGDIARAEKTIDAALALQPDSSWRVFQRAISTLRSICWDHRSRRPRRPSPKILTTPPHTRVLALTDYFSAAARRASRASKRRSG